MPETRGAAVRSGIESGSGGEICGWLAEMLKNLVRKHEPVDVDGGSAAKPPSVNQPIRRFVTRRPNCARVSLGTTASCFRSP